jgi:hypothetical protein
MDTSCAFLVLSVVTNCGINEAEVHIPAIRPIISIDSINQNTTSTIAMPVSLPIEIPKIIF